jgi:hypothetical protein
MKQSLSEKLKNSETRDQTLHELAAWVTATCKLFGVSPTVTYKVTVLMVEALEKETQNNIATRKENNDPPPD